MKNIRKRGKNSFQMRWTDANEKRHEETVKGTLEEAQYVLGLRRAGVARAQRAAISPKTFSRRRLHMPDYSCPGVYFLCSRANGLVKIGHSAGANKRVAALACQSSVKLQIVAFIPAYEHLAAERCIHRFLQSKRVHGEWFRITAADIENAIRHWVISTPAFSPDFIATHDQSFLPITSRLLEGVL